MIVVETTQTDTSSRDVQQRLSSGPVHFPWLTELRFFTALAVVIHHSSTARYALGIGPYPHGLIQIMGPNGVRVFFVLSGFLITHLLLSEIKETGTVAVKKFYFRRALRIWPLYYTLLAVSFLIPTALFVLKPDSQMAQIAAAQMQNFGLKMFLFIFMLPNLALILFQPIAGFSQSWSIGVEEQFYCAWPVLMKKFARHPLKALIGALLMKVGVCEAVLCILRTHRIHLTIQAHDVLQHASDFLASCQIEAMVIGGLSAYLFMTKPKFVRGMVGKVPFVIALVAGMLWANSEYFTKLHHLILVDIVFAAFILWLTNQDRKPPAGLRGPLTYLGKISYGIYMLHPLVIFCCCKLFYRPGMDTTSGPFSGAISITSVAASIAVAMLSYELLEKRFLIAKSKYAVVQSSAG